MLKNAISFGGRLIRHELITGSFYVFLGSIFGNLLAFILNLFLARSLSYSDYAIYASLLSVITLVAIPSSSINTVIVKFATGYFVKNEYDKLKKLYLTFLKFISSLFILIIVMSFIFYKPFIEYLHIDSIWYSVICGFTISAFYLNALNYSFLQSMLKFKFMAFANIIGSILKIAVGIALIISGFKAYGGIGALLAMISGMFFIAFFPLRKILKEKTADKTIDINIRQILSYAVPSFITILFLTSFTSVDVILVKHFFSPEMAGYYSGLSLLGKVIFYFTAPIPMVMFPLLVKRHISGKNFNNLFYLALLMVCIPSFVITFVYFVFPEFIINLFLAGRGYLIVSEYLGIFGIYLTVFSLVNVGVSLFLSLNKTNVSVPVLITAVMQFVLIYIFHNDFYQVIGVSVFALAVLFVYLIMMFFKSYGNLKEVENASVLLNTNQT